MGRPFLVSEDRGVVDVLRSGPETAQWLLLGFDCFEKHAFLTPKSKGMDWR
jgi:hypothetical protein